MVLYQANHPNHRTTPNPSPQSTRTLFIQSPKTTHLITTPKPQSYPHHTRPIHSCHSVIHSCILFMHHPKPLPRGAPLDPRSDRAELYTAQTCCCNKLWFKKSLNTNMEWSSRKLEVTLKSGQGQQVANPLHYNNKHLAGEFVPICHVFVTLQILAIWERLHDRRGCVCRILIKEQWPQNETRPVIE